MTKQKENKKSELMLTRRARAYSSLESFTGCLSQSLSI